MFVGGISTRHLIVLGVFIFLKWECLIFVVSMRSYYQSASQTSENSN